MPNNTGGASGATTALLAILVIAVIAFGIWYVMKQGQAPADNTNPNGLQINVTGNGGQNPAPQPPAGQPNTY